KRRSPICRSDTSTQVHEVLSRPMRALARGEPPSAANRSIALPAATRGAVQQGGAGKWERQSLSFTVLQAPRSCEGLPHCGQELTAAQRGGKPYFVSVAK